jgi:large subunit ribosomal protein L19
MPPKTEIFNKNQLKQNLPEIRPGDTVRVFQKTEEKGKEKIQSFEGIIIARKHGKGISATVTVRKIISGVGVEKIFPIHSPLIKKIEILKRAKVRRAKLYYLRTAKGRKARLKRKDFAEATFWEKPPEDISDDKINGEKEEKTANSSSETKRAATKKEKEEKAESVKDFKEEKTEK